MTKLLKLNIKKLGESDYSEAYLNFDFIYSIKQDIDSSCYSMQEEFLIKESIDEIIEIFNKSNEVKNKLLKIVIKRQTSGSKEESFLVPSNKIYIARSIIENEEDSLIEVYLDKSYYPFFLEKSISEFIKEIEE